MTTFDFSGSFQDQNDVSTYSGIFLGHSGVTFTIFSVELIFSIVGFTEATRLFFLVSIIQLGRSESSLLCLLILTAPLTTDL